MCHGNGSNTRKSYIDRQVLLLKCPTCTLRNPATLVTIEASFPYDDTGVECSDAFSPTTTVTETSNVNVEAVGT